MNAPSARVVDDTPDDLRFPSGFVPAPIDRQIAIARKGVQAWKAAHLEATQRQRGHGSMHWNTYITGLHERKSVLWTLVQIKQQQEAA